MVFTEDGLDRHAALGAFEKESPERDHTPEIGFNRDIMMASVA
jgi:hypothetical protein